MNKKIIFGLLVSFFLAPLTSHAHGVKTTIGMDEVIIMDVSYDDGEPLGYADITVFNQYDKLPFQTGRTDKNGRFAFCPDSHGHWRITINDGNDHMLTVKAVVKKKNNKFVIENNE